MFSVECHIQVPLTLYWRGLMPLTLTGALWNDLNFPCPVTLIAKLGDALSLRRMHFA